MFNIPVRCQGIRNGMICYGDLYRCARCLNVGCALDGCSNQAFNAVRCLRCGAPVVPYRQKL